MTIERRTAEHKFVVQYNDNGTSHVILRVLVDSGFGDTLSADILAGVVPHGNSVTFMPQTSASETAACKTRFLQLVLQKRPIPIIFPATLHLIEILEDLSALDVTSLKNAQKDGISKIQRL